MTDLSAHEESNARCSGHEYDQVHEFIAFLLRSNLQVRFDPEDVIRDCSVGWSGPSERQQALPGLSPEPARHSKGVSLETPA